MNFLLAAASASTVIMSPSPLSEYHKVIDTATLCRNVISHIYAQEDLNVNEFITEVKICLYMLESYEVSE